MAASMAAWGLGDDSMSISSVSPPAPAISPVPTRLQDLYYDPRTDFTRPDRFVRAFVGATGSCVSISRHEDRARCVIAGKESLRVLRIQDPPASYTEAASVPRRSMKPIAKGVGGAQIFDEVNLWSTARLGIHQSATDVGWGSGAFSNKIVTACGNGDVILWDVNKNGSKLEKHFKGEHTRAVNKIAFSTLLPNFFITGSQDGHLKIWDLRSPGTRNSLPHRSPPRSLVMSPIPSCNMHCLVALESGDIVRWDLRQGGKGRLFRIPVAHRGPILGMEWTPSLGDGMGWLCTGGMDKIVNIWDMSTLTLGSTPFHTLHTPHPVRRVRWRPGCDTEVAIVPQTPGISPSATGPIAPVTAASGALETYSPTYTSLSAAGGANSISEADRIELWDVRRGWVGKYVLLGGEGSVSDIAWSDSNSLWAGYSSGCFTQHDVRFSYAPIDTIPRHAISSSPSGGIAVITGKSRPGEIPFDDIQPSMAEAAAERGVIPKSPADAPYESLSQAGAYHVYDEIESVVALARTYVLNEGTRIEMCVRNAQAAQDVGDFKAAGAWHLLHSLLTPIITPDELRDASVNRPPSDSMSLSRSGLSNSVTFADNASLTMTKLPSHSRNPSRQMHRRRTSSTEPFSVASARTQRSLSVGLPRGTSPSTDLRNKHGIISPTMTPLTPSNTRYPLQRTPPGNTRGTRGRVSRDPSVPGRSRSMSAAATIKETEENEPGDGALGDSDESSLEEYLEEEEEEAVVKDVTLTPPLPPPHKTLRSPLSQTLIAASNSPSSSASSSSSQRIDSEGHARAPARPNSPESDVSGGAVADDNYNTSSSMDVDSPVIIAADRSYSMEDLPHIPELAPLRKPPLIKYGSATSIDTAVPPPRKQARGRLSTDSAGGPRAPSPSWARSVRPGVSSLVGNRVGAEGGGVMRSPRARSGELAQSERGRSISRKQQSDIIQEEQRFRAIGWTIMNETLEEYIEQGDVQLGAALANVGGEALMVDESRVERLTTSYIDMLSRLRLHTSASAVRKTSPFLDIRKPSTLDTTVYTSCGSCRKPLLGNPSPSPSPGVFQYCTNCKRAMARCSICHLPVRGLHFFCQVCSHGGHHECYRAYHLARPMVEVESSSPERPIMNPQRNSYQPRLSSTSRGSVPATITSDHTADNASPPSGGVTEEGGDEARDRLMGPVSSGERRRLKYHPCAAGCGHNCWAANEDSQL